MKRTNDHLAFCLPLDEDEVYTIPQIMENELAPNESTLRRSGSPEWLAKRRGRKLLHWGVGLYTCLAIVPLLCMIVYQIYQAAHVVTGLLVLIAYDLFHGSPLLMLLISPWMTIRGSNWARTVAGIVALFAALFCVPACSALFVEEARHFGLIAIILFSVCCFLTNVFLINKDVQAYVSSVRSTKGQTANHWSLED